MADRSARGTNWINKTMNWKMKATITTEERSDPCWPQLRHSQPVRWNEGDTAACSPPSLSFPSAHRVSIATWQPAPRQPDWQMQCQPLTSRVHRPLLLQRPGQPSAERTHGKSLEQSRLASRGPQASTNRVLKGHWQFFFLIFEPELLFELIGRTSFMTEMQRS